MQEVVNLLNDILGIFNQLWMAIVSFLPGSPFKAIIANLSGVPYMAELNWFFPVHECVIVIEVWLTAVALYYTYMAIMRFIRIL